MRAYAALGRMRFIAGLQYRSAALAGVATQLFFGFIFIMVYVAFYKNSAVTPEISLPQVVSYIWLQQMFLGFIALWFRDNEIFEHITSGSVAYELCRPCETYSFWYAKLIATRLASVTLRCLPLLLVVFFLPEPYRFHLPPSLLAAILFVTAMLIGLLLVVALSMLIYISVFWTMSPTGSTLMFAVAGEFLAGMIIPVPLMPEWLQKIVTVLPFRWTVDFPFRVYSGHIPIGDAMWGLGIQLVWLIIIVLFGRFLIRKALKQVVIQGG